MNLKIQLNARLRSHLRYQRTLPSTTKTHVCLSLLLPFMHTLEEQIEQNEQVAESGRVLGIYY